MSSILDPDFLEISELKIENQRLRNQLIVEQNKYNGLPNIICKWIGVYGKNYIRIPKSSKSSAAKGPYKGPYISGTMCTDLRSLIDNIMHGNISIEHAYMRIIGHHVHLRHAQFFHSSYTQESEADHVILEQ